MTADLHRPVLLGEAVQALVTNRNGHYVDCTYGRGGHSRAIVAALGTEGRLLVLDRDQAAVAHARAEFAANPGVTVVHSEFSALRQHVCEHGLDPLDGALLDLGVSSPQLDDADRGFSFNHPGPLDMRMNQQAGETAAQWLSRASEPEITDVLKQYGEERFARRIAQKIIQARQVRPIESTSQLVGIVETAVPVAKPHRRNHHHNGRRQKHPATKTFQAIRIQINQELQELETCLQELVGLLKSGGRIVIISFHSLEDRLVKRFFRRLARGDDLPPRLPVRESQLDKKLKLIGKPIRASAAEVAGNRRARSSIMRVAEKL